MPAFFTGLNYGLHNMKTAILIFYFAWPHNGIIERQHPMPTMTDCLAILKQTRINTPAEGNDDEWVVIATCKYAE